MFQKRLLISGIFFLTIFFFSFQNISACTCAEKSTVLDAFEQSELVIITKMIAVEKVGGKQDKYDTRYIRSVKMKVEKVYKGNVKVGDELTFAQGNDGFCTKTFREESLESKFLFYIDKPTKDAPWVLIGGSEPEKPMYFAITCGRSGGLAKADLRFLDNLEKLRSKTRISGEIFCWCQKGFNRANIKIKIIGRNKTYKVKTDEEGFFEIYDIPAGEYLIELPKPKNLKIVELMLSRSRSYKSHEKVSDESKYQIKINLEEKRHAELGMIFEEEYF